MSRVAAGAPRRPERVRPSPGAEPGELILRGTLGTPAVAVGLAALLVLAEAVRVALEPWGADVSWLVYVAGRVARGAHLYVDIFENNPPLIIWLTLPSTVVARLTGTAAVPVFQAMVGALAVGSLALALRLLRPVLAGADRGFVLVVLTFVLVPLTGAEFGQREHLMLLLFTPYLCALVLRLRGSPLGRRTALALGSLAAVGIALKPHFLLLWLAAEAYLAWRRGARATLRPEPIALAGTLALYALLVVALAPAYFRLLPRIAAAYPFGTPISQVALRPGSFLVVGAALLAVVVPARAAWRELRALAVVASIVLLAIAIVQQQGFDYHFYPAVALGVLVLGLTLPDLGAMVDRRLGRPVVAPVAALSFALVLGWSAAMGAEEGIARGRSVEAAYYRRMADVLRGHGSFVFLTVPHRASFPAANEAGIRWGIPLDGLHFLVRFYADQGGPAGAEDFRSPSEMSDGERWFFRRVVDAVVASPPELLVVDESPLPRGLRRPFDFIGYFAQDTAFERLFEEYGYETSVGGCTVYRHGSRTPRPALPPAECASRERPLPTTAPQAGGGDVVGATVRRR